MKRSAASLALALACAGTTATAQIVGPAVRSCAEFAQSYARAPAEVETRYYACAQGWPSASRVYCEIMQSRKLPRPPWCPEIYRTHVVLAPILRRQPAQELHRCYLGSRGRNARPTG